MTDIILHRAQSEPISWLFSPLDEEDWKMRFAVVVGSRGLGKTYTAGAGATLAVSELEQLDPSIQNKNIIILCGSHTQVIDIYYPLLAYTFGLEARCEKSSHSQGRFKFMNGTEIRCWSSDAYERIRGTGNYMIIADEMPSWSVPGSNIKDVWESVLEPSIVTRWSPEQARLMKAWSPGRALLPSTPRGKDFFYDLSEREHNDDRWKTFRYTYKDSPTLSTKEIETVRRYTDPLKFAREYEASFEESGLNVFYTFTRKLHVKNDLPYFDENEIIHCAIDFNIMMNCTSFHAIRGNQLHCLDEHQGSANTEELTRVIKAKFPKNKIICYPDPTGNSRKTSAAVGVTDFTILREAGFTVLARSSSPSIIDSVAAVNRKLLNANGEVDLFISNKCHGVIRSLERTTWLENRPETAIIDKTQNLEHYSDGVRYIVEYNWPINYTRPVIAQSSSF